MRSVLRSGMALVGAGMLLGLLAALAGARSLSSLLFGVDPADPLVYGMVALLLLATALAATWLPARRAARVDPMTSLRNE
jgi:ABC-type antimicrobial peptide transport system permease subunit